MKCSGTLPKTFIGPQEQIVREGNGYSLSFLGDLHGRIS